MMTDDSFYSSLESFVTFDDIANSGYFAQVPEDWVLLVTDIRSSTEAIQDGKYRDVNTIGAASIVVIQNLLTDIDFPYSFGGDGASMLIPSQYREAAQLELAALRNIAELNFGLQLRVGAVPVKDLANEGASIQVAKFELHAKKCVAVFKGGGMTAADRLIKNRPDLYEVPSTERNSVNMDGLSCRWNEIPNTNGCIMSLLVAANPESNLTIYSDFITRLRKIFGGRISAANPVHPSRMTYRSASSCAQNERRFYSKLNLPGLFRRMEIQLCSWIFDRGLPPLFFNKDEYVKSMKLHSDYRKFDDMVRFTLDCSESQVADIREYLEDRKNLGELHYGIHISDSSLMTCYVHGVTDGNHIHFIDGGGGGYALAAKQLKQQTL